MRFQINHLPNNEESTELQLITCSSLRKGQTAVHVIQMALFLELRQIWSSISSKPLFFLLSSSFFFKQLINSGADLNSSLFPA